ncbi:MAG: phosphoribosyltransferase [Cryomorphaceae bacterium]|nr:phosphoribosyltransferase [Cryomorphaceae bacterium]
MQTPTGLIMDASRIKRSLTRMAWQIYENHHLEEQVILAGIQGRGVDVMQRLADILEEIATFSVKRVIVDIDKSEPWTSDVVFKELDFTLLSSVPIVLVDDVLNSGKTIIYAMSPLIRHEMKKLSLAVLVDRSHKRFPLQGNVVGLRLSTSSHEHVRVSFTGEECVYLE